jgi:hypothetical protein
VIKSDHWECEYSEWERKKTADFSSNNPVPDGGDENAIESLFDDGNVIEKSKRQTCIYREQDQEVENQERTNAKQEI